MTFYDRLENLYDYWYKERDNMERSVDFLLLSKELPEVKVLWGQYKDEIAHARSIFEFQFEKLLEKYKND